MRKVYIIVRDGYEDDGKYIDCYSSRKLAEQEVEKLNHTPDYRYSIEVVIPKSK